MTNEQEINAKIDAEYKKWNDSLFELEPLPKDFIERFKKAIFKLPAKTHQLSTVTINKVIKKKVKELTNLDVPIIINAIQLLPMCDLYSSLEEGLIKTKEVEDIKIGYNIMVQKLNTEMETKRQNMLTLSNPAKQPLKLVKAQA